MQIDWWTLALQAVNFLVLVWLLRRFLYRPVQDVIAKRKKLAEQAFAEAAAREKEADAVRLRYEQDRAGLVQERQDMLKALHDAMETERAAVLAQAKDEARQVVADARKTIDEERRAALADMRDQLADLAADLAADLLGRTGARVPADYFIEQLDGRLKALPEEERARLKGDVEADGGGVTIVTAAPLTADERERWSARLTSALGCPCRTEFATDPALVGGAELHFPHAVLKYTWADQLTKARDLVREDDVHS